MIKMGQGENQVVGDMNLPVDHLWHLPLAGNFVTNLASTMECTRASPLLSCGMHLHAIAASIVAASWGIMSGRVCQDAKSTREMDVP